MIENLLLVVICLPLLGCFFVTLSKDERPNAFSNASTTAVWTILFNIFLILTLFSSININTDKIQAISRFEWQIVPKIELVLGVDVLALILMLGIHLAILIGVLSLKQEYTNQKSEIACALVFLFSCSGLLSAVDLCSFFAFFTFMFIPLFMQIGLGKNPRIAGRFFSYNALGSMLLLLSISALYSYANKSILISDIANIHIHGERGVWIWSGIFMAFMFRIPVWPFHYWISSVNTTLRNPLSFISASILPVSGLLGFIRFWPSSIPEQISSLTPVFAILCVATMCYLAFRAYSSVSIREKLFSYTFIYYLLYLLGVFSPTDILQRNLAYSLFAFLLVISALSMITFHMERESLKSGGILGGMLCVLPRASLAYVLLILAAVGFPVSGLFWNNFIILSQILTVNICIGTIAVLTILLAAIFMLQNLYILKDKSCLFISGENKLSDIDVFQFGASIMVAIIMFLSFIKPLWFVY